MKFEFRSWKCKLPIELQYAKANEHVKSSLEPLFTNFFMSSKMCILSNRRKSMPTNNIKATGFRDISVWEIKFYILLQQSMELTIAFQRKTKCVADCFANL